MRKPFLAAGIGLSVLWAYLLLAPIASGSLTSDRWSSGNSLDIYVPWADSVTGSPVSVRLSWGTAPWCTPSYGPGCAMNGPATVTITVHDCGGSPCAPARNYSEVGSATFDNYGTTGFSATPGHHYQIGMLVVSYRTVNGTTIPTTENSTIRYSIETPVWGGALGLVVIGGGIAAAILATRRRRDGALATLQENPELLPLG